MVHGTLPLPWAAALCAASLAISAPPANAQLDVAIVASASTNSADCRFTNVQSLLMASGQFNSVDIINVNLATPSLADLTPYQAVICWTNFQPASASAWGDVMADYVDAGGGVVVAVFANASIPMGGRWVTGGYEVITGGGQTQGGGPFTLGTVHDPAHPVMQNVVTFSGGTQSFRPTVTNLTAGSTSIAEWSDGRVLVAEGANPQRIDLGFYPPPDTCVSSFWDSTTDGDDLLVNSLVHVAASPVPPVSYCTAGTTFDGCHATMGSAGVPRLSNSEPFTLSCTNVPGNKNGIFFYGITGRVASPWGIGGTSFLCVKAPTQRINPVAGSGGTPGQCDGSYARDWNAYVAANPLKAVNQAMSVGSTIDAQVWFRDPNSGTGPVGAKGTALSNGLEFVVSP